MYSIRKPMVNSILPRPKTTARVHALVHRMRVISIKDEKLARLLEELEPYLPVHVDLDELVI